MSTTTVAPRTSHIPLAATGLGLGMLLSVLDQTIVGIAIPDIATDLGTVGSLSWIVTCYVLASTATSALYGRLSDRFGRRDVFLTAVGIFTIASALCGIADSLAELVLYRTLQGIGAGALFTIPTIAVAELFPIALRSRVQGAVGAIFAIAAVSGPLLGGLITDTLGWRWIFYVNVPLGILSMALVGTALRLPRSRSTARLDLVGSVLLVGTVIGVLVITEWSSGSHPAGFILGLAAAVVVLIGGFIWWERRFSDPVLPLHLFTHRGTGTVLASTLVLGALMYASIVYLPTYLRAAFDMSATAAGLALNPYVVAFVAASFLSGAFAGRTGKYRWLLTIGAAVICIGFLMLGLLDAESSYPVVALDLIMLGIGVGTILQLLVTVAQNTAATPDLAAVTAAALSMRGLGMSLGLAIFGRILSHQLPANPAPPTTADAIPHALLWTLPLAVLLLTLTFLIPTPADDSEPRHRKRKPGHPTGPVDQFRRIEELR
ncbi:MDR family MFS transporter [Nocardia sp. CA-107356]|uniref:MDR family MFS transporter n=1 Tax=Nocardia sp. CA-107356 TaxID=3239972 RepID=UPI003D90D432